MTHTTGSFAIVDPLDFEISPGLRVRDLATSADCLNAVMTLDMDMENIMSQIAKAESAPRGVDAGWRTRAQSAMRWKKRIRKAVIARQVALARLASPTEDRRVAIMQVIRREIGDVEFDRCVGIAKQERPDLGWTE